MPVARPSGEGPALTGVLLHSDGNKSPERLCQLNSKGEEISTMLSSGDRSAQAGFLKRVGWMNGCMVCRRLFVS